MNKLNTYYFGEDLSHCGSCWEMDDETTYVLLTTLTVEEMKDKFEEYCWSLGKGFTEYQGFLKWMSAGSEYDKENQVYPTIYFEVKGTSYAPDMGGSLSSFEEYDLEKELKLEDLKDYKKLKKIWDEGRIKEEEREKKRKENAEKDEERKAKNAERQRKYREKKKEFEDYKKLKDKWEGKKSPSKPKDDPKPLLEIDSKNLVELNSLLKKHKEELDGK